MYIYFVSIFFSLFFFRLIFLHSSFIYFLFYFTLIIHWSVVNPIWVRYNPLTVCISTLSRRTAATRWRYAVPPYPPFFGITIPYHPLARLFRFRRNSKCLWIWTYAFAMMIAHVFLNKSLTIARSTLHFRRVQVVSVRISAWKEGYRRASVNCVDRSLFFKTKIP